MGFAVGQSAEVSRSYADQDVAAYVALGGHRASGAMVPEPLINSLFSYLLGVRLPGQGTAYLKQESDFVGAAPIDEELTARVEIIELRPEKHLVDLRTTCRTSGGLPICEGRALVYVADLADR